MPMPMLFADSRFRSPMAVPAPATRAFVRMYHVKGLREDGSGELLVEFQHEAVIRSVCGLGDSRPDATLRLITVEPPYGNQKEAKEQLQFQCDQLLLDFRRVNVETKVNPHVILGKSGKLKITVDTPMMVWLLGVEHPRRCSECAGIDTHAPSCPLRFPRTAEREL